MLLMVAIEVGLDLFLVKATAHLLGFLSTNLWAVSRLFIIISSIFLADK